MLISSNLVNCVPKCKQKQWAETANSTSTFSLCLVSALCFFSVEAQVVVVFVRFFFVWRLEPSLFRRPPRPQPAKRIIPLKRVTRYGQCSVMILLFLIFFLLFSKFILTKRHDSEIVNHRGFIPFTGIFCPSLLWVGQSLQTRLERNVLDLYTDFLPPPLVPRLKAIERLKQSCTPPFHSISRKRPVASAVGAPYRLRIETRLGTFSLSDERAGITWQCQFDSIGLPAVRWSRLWTVFFFHLFDKAAMQKTRTCTCGQC